jgi:hypothetical protein
MVPTPKIPMVRANLRGLASAISSDEGLRIGGRGVSDEFKGKADKQGEYDCIIKTKLWLQARSQCVPPPAPPSPLHRWPGPRVLVGYDTKS